MKRYTVILMPQTHEEMVSLAMGKGFFPSGGLDEDQVAEGISKILKHALVIGLAAMRINDNPKSTHLHLATDDVLVRANKEQSNAEE